MKLQENAFSQRNEIDDVQMMSDRNETKKENTEHDELPPRHRAPRRMNAEEKKKNMRRDTLSLAQASAPYTLSSLVREE